MPARTPTGFLWSALVDRWGGQEKAKRTGFPTSSTYSHGSSDLSDDSEPAPETSATHMLPTTRAAPFAVPPTTMPTAQLAAPPPLPPDLAQMFDEPIGLSAAPTAPLAASAAPTVSSSSWLVDEIEVSDTPHVYILNLPSRAYRFTYLLTCLLNRGGGRGGDARGGSQRGNNRGGDRGDNCRIQCNRGGDRGGD